MLDTNPSYTYRLVYFIMIDVLVATLVLFEVIEIFHLISVRSNEMCEIYNKNN